MHVLTTILVPSITLAVRSEDFPLQFTYKVLYVQWRKGRKGGSEDFYFGVTIPEEPFRIEIGGLASTGQPYRIVSDVYYPAPLRLKLLPSSGLISRNEGVTLNIQATASTTDITYTVKLVLPPGVTGNVGPWEINPKKGESITIPVGRITAVDGESFDRLTIKAVATPTKDPSLGNVTSAIELTIYDE